MTAEERRIQALEDELRTLKLQHGIGSSGSGSGSAAGDGGGSDQLSMVNGRRRGSAAISPTVSGGGEYGCGGGTHSGIAEGGLGGLFGLCSVRQEAELPGRWSVVCIAACEFLVHIFVSEKFPGRLGVYIHRCMHICMYTWWLNGVAACCLV